MSTFRVLTIGVCLAAGLYAADAPRVQGDPLIEKQQAALKALERRDYNEAMRLYRECMALAANDNERFAVLGSYGIALHEADRNQEAKVILEAALAGQEKIANGQNRVIISDALAGTDRSLGDYGTAEQVLRTAIGYHSGTPEQRAKLILDLADILREEARESEAFAVLNEANQMRGLAPGSEFALLLETGEVAREMGRWDESLAAWNKLGEQASREQSPHLEAMYAGGLGETWLDAGNLTRAEPLLRRSLQLLRGDSDSSAAQVATALGVLTRLYIQEDKLALAEETLDEAVTKGEASFEAGHPQLALMLEMRAQIFARRGEMQAAREDLERSRVMMTSHFGANSMAVACVLAISGDVEARAGQTESAAAEYKAAFEIARAAGADGSRFGSRVAASYSAMLKAAHRSGEARAVMAAAAGLQSFVGR